MRHIWLVAQPGVPKSGEGRWAMSRLCMCRELDAFAVAASAAGGRPVWPAWRRDRHRLGAPCHRGRAQRGAVESPGARRRPAVGSRCAVSRRLPAPPLAARRREPALEFQTALQAELSGVNDPEVLPRAARDGRILVTHDRKTMPRHFFAFIATATSAGVLIVPQHLPIAAAVDDLLLIWDASEAEE